MEGTGTPGTQGSGLVVSCLVAPWGCAGLCRRRPWVMDSATLDNSPGGEQPGPGDTCKLQATMEATVTYKPTSLRQWPFGFCFLSVAPESQLWAKSSAKC